MEETVNGYSDDITSLQQDVIKLKHEVASLEQKNGNLEARSRRCNLCIIGVKERREDGKHAPEFVSQLLKDTLGLEKAPLLNRAHPTLRKRPGEDRPARAFVVPCHYIQERETLIKNAIQKKEIITPDGDRILIQPDYTQKVAKQRAAFNEVRGELCEVEGVRYGLFYPAELRVTAKDGTRRNFNDAKLAVDFVKRTLKS